MKEYEVKRAFRHEGLIRMPKQRLTLDTGTAARYRRAGVIGIAEQATAPPRERAVREDPERAVKKPTEQRKPGRPKKKESEVKDEPETGDAAGD